MKRSDKDNAALAKAETELHYASEVCHALILFVGEYILISMRFYADAATSSTNELAVGVQRRR